MRSICITSCDRQNIIKIYVDISYIIRMSFAESQSPPQSRSSSESQSQPQSRSSSESPSESISERTANRLGKNMKISLTKVSDHIYLGSLNIAKDYSILRDNQIDYVLNVTNSIMKINSQCGIRCMNQPISSKSFRRLMRVIPQCVEFINEAVTNKKNIAICCRDGYSKTAVMLTAYYILRYNKDYKTVSKYIKTYVPQIPFHVCTEYETYLDQMRRIIKQSSI
jgi:hypothetical protein